MKQTAVDWLLDNLISDPYSEKDFEHNEKCWDKAKEMEKEQMIDGITQVIMKKFNAYSESEILRIVKTAEKYYNETYGEE